jgi:predicted transcriptional regulator
MTPPHFRAMVSARRYKDYKVYSCFVLNQLVSALGIDIHQNGLEDRIDEILSRAEYRVTKADIMHEIRSNHTMTNKILDILLQDGHITLEKEERSYRIHITRAGVLHIREFNKFYLKIYEDAIKDHYRFRGVPPWARK